MALITPDEWRALQSIAPGGGSSGDAERRETLFKELVVRAARAPENRNRQQKGLKGSLKLEDVQGALEGVLESHGVSTDCFLEVAQLIRMAFPTAQTLVNSVSLIDRSCIDMNQFHALVIIVMHFAFICNFALGSGVDPSSATIDCQTIQELLSVLLESEGLLGSTTADVSTLKVYFDGIASETKSIPFMEFMKRYNYEIVKVLVNSDKFANGSRGRAFHLLQALNNTPSLPNMVPGPFPLCLDSESTATSLERPQMYLTTHRQFFPEIPLRGQKDHQYAPARQSSDVRDEERRIFPIELRVPTRIIQH
jgi:hypothetical protein